METDVKYTLKQLMLARECIQRGAYNAALDCIQRATDAAERVNAELERSEIDAKYFTRET